MAQPVKISDEDMDAVRQAARLHNRSLASQAEHWLRLGRAVERDPRFGFVQIEEALHGLRPMHELTGEQQESVLDRFEEEVLMTPSSNEAAFWADRVRRGLGVGMDDAGNIVFATAQDAANR